MNDTSVFIDTKEELEDELRQKLEALADATGRVIEEGEPDEDSTVMPLEEIIKLLQSEVATSSTADTSGNKPGLNPSFGPNRAQRRAKKRKRGIGITRKAHGRKRRS